MDQLKLDGIYVQIGTREWDNGFYKSSDCWYNLIKIINDDYAVVMGLSTFHTFMDKDEDEYKERKHGNSMRKFLGVGDCDILNVVTQLKEFDWSVFLVANEEGRYECGNYGGIYVCKLTKYKAIDENFDEENILQLREPYDPSDQNEKYIRRFDYCRVNDSFNAIILNDDYSKFYAWHSPCMAEEPDNGQENTFPYYFIPNDFSSKETWYEKYLEWKAKFDNVDLN